MECGALNGEKGSNSLFFERVRKWNGLLIEGDPSNYAELKKKNRKAFSINACLSPRKTAAKVPSYNVCWEIVYLFVIEYVVITVVSILLGPSHHRSPFLSSQISDEGIVKYFSLQENSPIFQGHFFIVERVTLYCIHIGTLIL